PAGRGTPHRGGQPRHGDAPADPGAAAGGEDAQRLHTAHRGAHMSSGVRLLSLAARTPAALLPFAAALGLADAGVLPAVGTAAAALVGYGLAQLGAPWLLQRVLIRHVLLCAAVVYVVLSVLLIVSVEQ